MYNSLYANNYSICRLFFALITMQIVNKKAKFNYILYERIEAGVSLTGAEVKAIKTGRGDLSNSYAKIIE